MANSGSAWFMPLTWPFGYVASAVLRPEDEKPTKNTAHPTLDLVGNITSVVASLRATIMAYLAIYSLYDERNPYPAFGPAMTLDSCWIWPILVRNILSTWIIAGSWDYFLYFSPLKAKLAKYKMNPNYPSAAQFRHDALHCTIASVCGTAIEVLLCFLWANNYASYEPTIMGRPWFHLCLAATITHWRIPHFYAIHRLMHPWKTTLVPDLGKLLYRHVHSLHHKSYNPTAFSGTSMHPVEATLYYSAAFLCLPLSPHPVIALACIIDCAVGAWLGHDGFQAPGSGDMFHQLHHTHFDCNYGASHVPMDHWMGTFAGQKSDLKKIWGSGVQAGEEANETTVHLPSPSSALRSSPRKRR